VDQSQSLTYKQLGNGVNVGAVYNVLKAQVLRDLDLLGKSKLTDAILSAPANPDFILGNHEDYYRAVEYNKSAKEAEVPPLRLVN
jgi:DNA (cytosine-5)-methyltransferase 1